MSAKRGASVRELWPLYPASAAVLLMAWVADSVLALGVSAGLSIGILVLLAYWWARRPVDQWGDA